MQQHLRILLADGKTQIQAAVTAQSAERLQLTQGKEVLVLVKAPWVSVTPQDQATTNADNILAGRITHLQTGLDHSEIWVTLTGGEVLCATLTNATVARDALRLDQRVNASFSADQVIIATLC